MTTPGKDEVEQALAEAERLREAGTDEFGVAKTLLYWGRKIELLERVRTHAEHYIHFGLGEKDHTELVRALDRLKKFEEHEAGRQDEGLGLG